MNDPSERKRRGRKRFYRVGFTIDGQPGGTMLVSAISPEFAISLCAQSFQKTSKANFGCHSVNPIFMSDEEEHDFLHFVVLGNPAIKSDIVDIEQRLKGMV